MDKIIYGWSGIKTELNRFIAWGHYPVGSHTHSYPTASYAKAFKELGWDSHHVTDDISNIDLVQPGSLILTEGQQDQHLPIRADCLYIIHNCDAEKYKNVPHIKLQVYTDDILKYNFTKLDNCIYADHPGKTIYMPWATNLNKQEIELNKPVGKIINNSNIINWIGTIGDGKFGNRTELQPFIDEAKKDGKTFNQVCCAVSFEENEKLIRYSYMAPATVGSWQRQVGYVSCRLFKNISYSQPAITNSERCWELFDKRICFCPEPNKLYHYAKEYIENISVEQIRWQMEEVQKKHTFEDRINTILNFIEKVI